MLIPTFNLSVCNRADQRAELVQGMRACDFRDALFRRLGAASVPESFGSRREQNRSQTKGARIFTPVNHFGFARRVQSEPASRFEAATSRPGGSVRSRLQHNRSPPARSPHGS